jgi:hypothetical protein
MRLEEYWGIGPKTREQLEAQLGVERAVETVEAADTRTLVDAGLPRGRATRILRRVEGGEAMDVLATRDTRNVYKDLLALAGEYAVTEDAADRIRILTPMDSREAMDQRLDRVMEALSTWERLDEADRGRVRDAFEAHDGEGDRKSVV